LERVLTEQPVNNRLLRTPEAVLHPGAEEVRMAIDRAPSGLRHNRNWHMLLVAQGVSLVGDFVFDVTVLLWVATVVAAHRPWAPAAASGVLIAAAIPVLAIAPIAGVFVDRWDRRLIIQAADLSRAVVIAILLLIPSVGTRWPVAAQLTMIYAAVVLESIAAQFFNPARYGIIRAVLPDSDRARAFGISGAIANTAAVIGPPLAAPILFGAGVEWALVIDVVSFLVSFACASAIRLPAQERKPSRVRRGFWADFGEGLTFFAHNRRLVVMCSTTVVQMFAVGALNALNVFFMRSNLHTSSNWVGTLNAALGAGSIVGALLAARFAGWLGEARVFSYGVVLMGLSVVIYSRLGSLPAAIALFVVSGIPLAAVNVVINPLMLRATPKELIGRVATVMNPLVNLSSIVSMAIVGLLASSVLRNLHVVVAGVTFTRIDTIFAVGGLLMLAAGLVSIRPMQASEVRPAEVAPEEQQSSVGRGSGKESAAPS
jgi:MFS family permease